MSFFRRSTHPGQADLSAYVDGELPVAQARTIALHAESCTACRAELDALQETKSLLANLPRATLPHSFVLSPAQAGIRRAEPARPSTLRFAPAMTLSLLVVLLLVDVVSPSSSSNDRATTSLSEAPAAAKSAAESANPVQRSLQTAPAAGAPSSGRAPSGGSAGAAADSAAPSVAPPQPAVTNQAATSQAESAPVTPPAVFSAPVPLASPVANQGALAPVPLLPTVTQAYAAQTPAPNATPSPVRSDDGGGIGLLRLLEIIAAAGFVVSLVVVAWPKLTRKEP